MSRKAKFGALAALLILPLAGLVTFRGYLDGPFLFDDLHTIRDNPHISSELNPLYFFKHTASASRAPTTLVRPLLTFTYALDHRLSGPGPRGFRRTNLAMHVINALFLFGLTRQVKKLRPMALPCALLFLLHPLNSVQVGYVSNRSSLLSSAFYLAALWAFAHSHRAIKDGRTDTSRSILTVALLAALYACGLFSKAAASTLPASILLWAAAFGKGVEEKAGDNRRAIFFAVGSTAALLVVFFVYLLFRHAHSAYTFFPPARPLPVWEYAAAQTRVFWTYARLIAFPVHLSLEHEAWAPGSASALLSANFILSTGGIFLLVAVSLRYLRRAPEMSFAVIFSIIYLLPTSSVVPLVVLCNENRPYLSCLGLIWPLLILFENVRQRQPRVALAVLSVIIALFAALVVDRASAYHTEESAWQDAIEKAPGLSRPHVNLGVVLAGYGRAGLARSSYSWALEIDPCQARALNDLGNLSYREGRWDRAEGFYRRALECDPGSVAAMLNLADHLIGVGEYEEALELLERAIAVWPDYSEALGRLGRVYGLGLGDQEKGVSYLERAARFSASEAEAAGWLDLAGQLRRKNQ